MRSWIRACSRSASTRCSSAAAWASPTPSPPAADAQMATAIANATEITFMFTFVTTMRILYCAASPDRHGGFFEIKDVAASAAPRRDATMFRIGRAWRSSISSNDLEARLHVAGEIARGATHESADDSADDGHWRAVWLFGQSGKFTTIGAEVLLTTTHSKGSVSDGLISMCGRKAGT
jgi:hypothetical protein